VQKEVEEVEEEEEEEERRGGFLYLEELYRCHIEHE